MSLQPGFDPTEALPLMAICYDINCNTTGVKPPPNPPPPVELPVPPKPGSFGWELAYDPGKVVFADNYWQLWKNTRVTGQYALAFRGTTTNLDSIVEDVFAILVPASLSFLGVTVRLAKDPMAHVHVGFVGGLAAMLVDNLLLKLEEFAISENMTDLFVVGHSQGAALATLCHSFLHYQDVSSNLKGKVNLKSYIFAQPKPGNKHYAYDYELITSQSAEGYGPMGFRVTSDQDWVPQAPLSLQIPRNVSKPNPFSVPDFIDQKISRILHDIEVLNLPFDFQSAGCPIVLRAEPGSNPKDPDDFFWQHHGQQYYRYLKAQYASQVAD